MHGDSACDIMNKRVARKLLAELKQMRQNKGNISQREMVKFANRCGRKREKIGDEPTYYNIWLPEATSISIPGHTTQNLGHRVAGIILDRLEDDLHAILDQIDDNAEDESDDDGDEDGDE